METMENILKIEAKPINAMIVTAAAYAGYRLCKGTMNYVSGWIDEAKKKAEEMKQKMEAEAQQKETAAEGA